MSGIWTWREEPGRSEGAFHVMTCSMFQLHFHSGYKILRMMLCLMESKLHGALSTPGSPGGKMLKHLPFRQPTTTNWHIIGLS
ncbi:hypothetical protein QQP08_026325 [Theobroma cacao]|uniref:Uncharacterized protein n=1 Tax=Theobroma cacao TaxID=3641 RepID=A0A061GIN5_THECC|nr:Uncharacterized protein TCM_036861 [Theobroma cacao]WRX33838.1 hypothetical protein QQP08_026325 [Theobroma cacao]